MNVPIEAAQRMLRLLFQLLIVLNIFVFPLTAFLPRQYSRGVLLSWMTAAPMTQEKF